MILSDIDPLECDMEFIMYIILGPLVNHVYFITQYVPTTKHSYLIYDSSLTEFSFGLIFCVSNINHLLYTFICI